MNLDYLQTFIAVCEEGSFSKAARRLCLSQTTVSFQIKSLEKEYRTKLFERSSAGVTLTPAGRVLREYVERLDALQRETVTRIRACSETKRAVVRIGTSPVSGIYILTPLVSILSQVFPHTQIELEIRSGMKTNQMLNDGELDFAILEPCFMSKSFEYKFLNKDRIFLTTAPHAFFSSSESEVSLETLRRLPFVFREDECCTRLAVKQSISRAGFKFEELNIVMTITDIEAVKNVVKQGMAVAFLSEWAIYDDVQEGTLRVLDVPKLDLVRDRFVITTRGARLGAHAGRIVDYLMSEEIQRALKSPEAFRSFLASTSAVRA